MEQYSNNNDSKQWLPSMRGPSLLTQEVYDKLTMTPGTITIEGETNSLQPSAIKRMTIKLRQAS
jgi:hypothetical protein